MKLQRYKIFGCLLLIGAIVVSVGVALPDANADFGQTITTAQMANMFGGGFVRCGDTDCDTTSGACPGGSTCHPDDNDCICRACLTTTGQCCGSPNNWPGWMCEDTTASCNSVKGNCIKTGGEAAVCERYASPATPPDCAERPDC